MYGNDDVLSSMNNSINVSCYVLSFIYINVLYDINDRHIHNKIKWNERGHGGFMHTISFLSDSM